MKYVLRIIALCVMFIPISAYALTAEWERNTETDMKEYTVYGCFTSGCAVSQSPSSILGTVPQPVDTTVKPTWIVPTGKTGTIAVSAKDTSGNESPLSNSVSFDSAPPAAPAGLVIK